MTLAPAVQTTAAKDLSIRVPESVRHAARMHSAWVLGLPDVVKSVIDVEDDGLPRAPKRSNQLASQHALDEDDVGLIEPLGDTPGGLRPGS